jgi:hypothetical protein
VTKQNIHIERLQIRTRGISAETARAIAGDLGHEILDQLTTSGLVNHGNHRVARIDAGTTQVNSTTKPADLRSQVAKQVAGSIKKTASENTVK